MTPKNPFPRPTLPDSQETQPDRATKQTNAFGEYNQTAYDQYPAEGAILNNRYELLQKIGQGGMGQVYKALDIDASNIKSQPVFRAIKILSPALIGNQREIRRLQTEAMNAQELTHENIIRVHHFDKDSEHIYLIMEWLDGKSFNDLLTPPNHHGIAFSELKPYLPAIAKALDYAHCKNIIHRDIKPSNLFLTNDNRVVVIDFGVSYAINESQIRFSGTSGTPSYRPPEALVGGHQSGVSDDVYALAVTLYELLTGDLPYHGTLISSRNADSPKPRKPDSLSQAQWQVIFNAFYFEPSKRPQSVCGFIAELCAVENSLESEQKAEAETKRKAELAEAKRQTELAKKQAEAERQRLQEVKKQALLAEKKRQEDAEKAKKLAEEKARRLPNKTIDHYTVHNNGTVTDTKTGLTWQRCTYGQTWNGSGCSGEPKIMTWHEAMKIRDDFAGYSDWRLPTVDELGSLTYCSSGKPKGIYPGRLDYGCEGNYRCPTINTSVFPITKNWFYWSSSPYAYFTNDAWVVGFHNGYGDYCSNKDSNGYVRLVRGGQ